MKLLIISQKVDKNDPVLGFFHRWVEEFAKHYENLIIICLQKGDYDLPKNVKVLSLGKEKGESRIKYLWNFYKYIWLERKNYDNVFVHMNQEYVLLGGLFWKFLGKKISLWRNHAKGNFLTLCSVWLANRVFCTSSQSFTARFKKTKIMPVGIDTDFFRPSPLIRKKSGSILFLGRISLVKKVEIFIDALNELKKLGVDFCATIAGPALPRDKEYEKMLKAKVSRYGLDDKVKFLGPVAQVEALRLYQTHELYVNLTSSGSLDKTIFEAMACETVPLVYNQSLREVFKGELAIQDLEAKSIAKRIIQAPSINNQNNFRNFVVKEHGLKSLAERLREEIK